MELTVSILSVIGSIIIAFIGAIVSMNQQKKQWEQHKNDLINSRILSLAEIESGEDIRQSDAAQRISESAVAIVSRYEYQCDRMMKEIDKLKLEVNTLQVHREQDKKELERLSRELEISELHRNHLMEVNNMYVKQIVEANLEPIVITRTIEEIRAGVQ
jgi:hypothetical protein